MHVNDHLEIHRGRKHEGQIWKSESVDGACFQAAPPQKEKLRDVRMDHLRRGVSGAMSTGRGKENGKWRCLGKRRVIEND